MSVGLTYKHWIKFADLLIMANEEQLKRMAYEVMQEIERRKLLPKFSEVGNDENIV